MRNCDRNLSSIRGPALYLNLDRYKRAVLDLARVLAAVSPAGSSVSLVNYEHEDMSPVRSEDLIRAAEQPERDPFYPYFSARLKQLFSEQEPAFTGISVNYLSQALPAFSMLGYMKREFPSLRVIMGGGLITSWLRRPGWKNPFSGLVDHLVAGPGENELPSILGLKTTSTEAPTPNYLSLPLKDYLSPGFILPYSASSGCYWNRCGFCPEKAEGSSYTPVPAASVISDVEALKRETSPVLIHFLDNAISPALFKILAGSDLGIPWYGFARVSQYLTDLDFCMQLKRSGCVMLKLGIESGDQAVLDALEKGTSVKMSSAVLKNLKKVGIGAYVYLLFGTPPETGKSAAKTLEFTVEHADCINFLNLAIFNMPVCGDPADGIDRKGFYEGDLSLYTDFVHPAGWNRRRVREFLDREFKKHPAVSAILKKDPPLFTSNHAPFFLMGRGVRNAALFAP
ncbi:MAG TPA: radical SAM protein [Thermodesulfovibrionales bacterium]|nr:radical SAM protein [Thermodesulfovibrionales bacterium]